MKKSRGVLSDTPRRCTKVYEKERKAYHQFLLEGIKLIDDLKNEYTFDKEIEGEPKFYTISQRKYLRRKSKQRKIRKKKT